MPRAKSTTKKTKASSKKADSDSLQEFEQFVSQTPRTNGRGKGWLLLTFFIVIVILAAILWYVSKSTSLEKELRYKAIYLDNNQVYYAKVVKEDALSVYLDEVYYIQLEERTLPPQEEGGELQVVTVPVLVKRGEEVHKPEGWLQLNRDKIIAIEEIGEDSEVMQEINSLE